MINLLLNASVTGGIVILLWFATYPLSKKFFRASWHYAVLKAAMVFMAIPIGIFAPIFGNMLTGLVAAPNLPDVSEQIQMINIDAETVRNVNSALSDLVFPESLTVQTDNAPETTDNTNDTLPNIPYVQFAWLIVAALLFTGGVCKMHRFKKQIFNSSGNVDCDTLELFLQCKAQLKVRGRIDLRTSRYIKTPFVFGLTRPIVILPETDMSADEKRLALVHELTHIRHGDLWLKFAAYVISAVHWFNPLAHLLCREVSVISEEYCDECVVKPMAKGERVLYGNLILKVVSDTVAPQPKFCSTLSAQTKNLKRRLLNMMNTKKSRKSMIVLSVIAAFILCSFATVYAFATNTIEQGVKTPIDDINLKETPKDSDITIASEPIYPVDLEYFKDWEGWETEWEKFLEEYEKRWSQSHVDITKTIDLLKSPEYWNICPWKLIVKNTEGVMFQLKNGTEIETDGSFLTKQDKYLINLTKVFTSIEKEDPELLKNIPEHLKSLTLKPSSSIALMIPNHKSIIRLANGITIETSEYTLITVKLIANADHELEIIVGANEATITQPDGTSTTVPAGTILDGEGNVI